MSASFTAVLTKGTNGTGSSIKVTGSNLTLNSTYTITLTRADALPVVQGFTYMTAPQLVNSTTFVGLVDGTYSISAVKQGTPPTTVTVSPSTTTIYTNVPATPTITSISVGDGTITIDYTEGASDTPITANQAFIYSDSGLTSLMTQAGVTIGPSAATLNLTTLTPLSSSFVNGSTYYLTIKSTNENGTSEQSVSSSFTYSAPSNPGNPPPPSGPFLDQPIPNITDSNVSMSSSLKDAAGQTVTLWQWQSSTNLTTWNILQGGDVADVNGLYTITTDAPTTGVLYYRATATLSDNQVLESHPCAVEQLTTPTGLTATPGDGKVTLSWTSDAVTFEVLQLSAGGSYTPIASVTGKSYEVTSLTNGTTYTFQVRSIEGTPAGGYDTTTYKFIASTEADISATPAAAATPDTAFIFSNSSTATTGTIIIKGGSVASPTSAPSSGVTTTVWSVGLNGQGEKVKGATEYTNNVTIGAYTYDAGAERGQVIISGLTPNTDYWVEITYNTPNGSVITTKKFTATATYNDGETTTTKLVVDMALDSEDSGPFSGVSFELHKMSAMNNDLGVIYSSVQNSDMWNGSTNQFSFTGLTYELGNTYKLLFEAVDYALLTKSNLNVKSGVSPPTNNTTTTSARTVTVSVGETFVAGIQLGEPVETATWAITGGANQVLFELVNATSTGVTLQFKTAPTAATTTPYYVTVYQTSTTTPPGGNVEINYTVNVVDATNNPAPSTSVGSATISNTTLVNGKPFILRSEDIIDTSITFRWPNVTTDIEGANLNPGPATYNVYYYPTTSNLAVPSGNWDTNGVLDSGVVKANTDTINGAVSGINTFTISGLTAGTIYAVMVRSMADGYQWTNGTVAFVMPALVNPGVQLSSSNDTGDVYVGWSSLNYGSDLDGYAVLFGTRVWSEADILSFATTSTVAPPTLNALYSALQLATAPQDLGLVKSELAGNYIWKSTGMQTDVNLTKAQLTAAGITSGATLRVAVVPVFTDGGMPASYSIKAKTGFDSIRKLITPTVSGTTSLTATSADSANGTFTWNDSVSAPSTGDRITPTASGSYSVKLLASDTYEFIVSETSNSVSVTVSSDPGSGGGGSGSGSGSGSSGGAVCFLADAPVLTPAGYRPIHTLRVGDKVRTAAGRTVTVKRVFAKEYQAGPAVNPFVIPKGSFGALRALPISPNHEVMTAKGMVKAKDLGLPRMKMAGSFTYYNLELEDWVRDNLVVAGVECESLAPAKRITMTKAEFGRFVAARYGPAAAARLRTVCVEEADGSVSMPAL